MTSFVPVDPEQWRTIAEGMRSNLEGDMRRLDAYFDTPEGGKLRLTVTRKKTRVRLPDKTTVALEEWLSQEVRSAAS